MIKKLTTLLLILSVSITLNAQVETPQPSPSSKIEQTVGLTTIKIDYSRPAMRGRVIFGNLVPYGKLWRTGANQRTKISFDDDVIINGKDLKAGTYAIFSIPNEKSWEVYFYTDYAGSGTPAELDVTKVALKLNVETHTMSKDKQSFTMGIGNLTSNSGTLHIAWEKTKVAMKIETPSDAKAIKSIDATLAGPSANDYFQAASYYFSSEKDLNKAKTWIDKTIKMNNENPRFWQLRQQSLIYAKLDMKKEAIKIAEKSLKLSEEAGNADYAKMNTESIAEWSK